MIYISQLSIYSVLIYIQEKCEVQVFWLVLSQGIYCYLLYINSHRVCYNQGPLLEQRVLSVKNIE